MTVLGARAGVSQQMVSYLERGMRSPQFETVVQLCRALKLDTWKVIRRATPRARRSNHR
jgi:transcriptional regulator with XRE-family HTH domain